MKAVAVQSLCRRAERSRRLAAATGTALRAGAAACLACAVACVAARAAGFGWTALAGLLPALAAPLAGFLLVAFLGRRPLLEVAVALEERHGLKARLSTALALEATAAGAGGDAEIARAILRDAESRAGSVDARSLADTRFGRPAGALLLAAAGLTLATLFFPNLDLLGIAERRDKERARREVREREAEKLRDLAESLRERGAPVDAKAIAFDMPSELEKLADRIAAPTIRDPEAVREVSELSERSEGERERLTSSEPSTPGGTSRGLRTPEARDLARSLENRMFDRARESTEKLASEIAEGGVIGDRREDLAADLRELGAAVGGSAEVSEALSEAGKALEGARENSGEGSGEGAENRGDRASDSGSDAPGDAAASKSMKDAARALDALARARESRRELSAVERKLRETRRALGGSDADAARDKESEPAGQDGGAEDGGSPEGAEVAEPEAAPKGIDLRESDPGASGESDRPGEESNRPGSESSQGRPEGGERGSEQGGEQGDDQGAENAGAAGEPGGEAGEPGSEERRSTAGSEGTSGAPLPSRLPQSGASQSGRSGGEPRDASGGERSQSGAESSGAQGQEGSPASEGSESGSEGTGSEGSSGEGRENGENGRSGEGRGRGEGQTESDTPSDGQGSGQESGEGQGSQGRSGQGQGQGEGAGQGAGKGSGRSGRGQGQGEGEGRGQGSSEGAGAQRGAGRDFGTGTSNQAAPGYRTTDDNGAQDREADRAPEAWEEQFMSDRAGRAIEAGTRDARVRGTLGEGSNTGERETDGRVERVSPGAPVREMLAEAGRRERESLERQDIPVDYKDSVRRYFESLEGSK